MKEIYKNAIKRFTIQGHETPIHIWESYVNNLLDSSLYSLSQVDRKNTLLKLMKVNKYNLDVINHLKDITKKHPELDGIIEKLLLLI